jgi:hypothetical protein
VRSSVVAVLFLAALIIGCSNSPDKNPVSPSSPLTVQSVSTSNRHLWGIWDITISANRSSVEIAPMRTADMHLNVVKLLEGKACANCLKITNIYISGPDELSADITLTHPYPGLMKYTGFDVRGIFISTADYTFPLSGRKIALGDSVPRMLDPDGYTSLFNPTDFPLTTPAALGYIAGKHATGGDLSATLNPFIAYRKDAPRRMFESGGSETKTVKIHAPIGPIHFGYAVDVNWQLVENVVDPLTDFPPDANCQEAYEIKVSIDSGLQAFTGSLAQITVKVYDHQGQDTISSLMIEAPDLFTGEKSLGVSMIQPDGGFLFAGKLHNFLGAADGAYPVLVKAIDTQADQNLGEIMAWQVSLAIVSSPKGWARTWGGLDYDSGNSVVIDGSGNAYVTGYFQGPVDFDSGAGQDTHFSNGLDDVFLSKIDPDGNLVWARTWGGSGGDCGSAVAIDGSGNVFVEGLFCNTVDFDPGAGLDSHTSNGGSDYFLSKFDPNGNFVWARTWGGLDDDPGCGVAVDGSGNAYVAGWFCNTVDFDPGQDVDNHTSNGNTDAFLSKFDPNGNFLWARTWGGSSGDGGNSLAIGDSGNVYVTGAFKFTVDFDPGVGVDNQEADGFGNAFLSKFDENGNFLWVRTWGGLSLDGGNSVAIDGSGNVYIAGSFWETADFDPGAGVENHISNGSYEVFLSKIDSNGNFNWARTWGGSNVDMGNSVAIDPFGNAYITGCFSFIVDFDPGAGVDNRTSNGLEDVFLSKLDPNGNFVWVRTWGGSESDSGSSVAIDESGNSYIAGGFQATVDFDPGAGVDIHISFNGNTDAFLSKFPPDGDW